MQPPKNTPQTPRIFGLPQATLDRLAVDEPARLLFLAFHGGPANATSGWPKGIGLAARNRKPFSPPLAPVFILDRALTQNEKEALGPATAKKYRDWAQIHHRRQQNPYALIDQIHLYDPKKIKTAECEFMVFDCFARAHGTLANRKRIPFARRQPKVKNPGKSRSAKKINRGHTLRSATGVSPNLRAEKRIRRMESRSQSARPKTIRKTPQRKGFLAPSPHREFKHEPRGIQPGVPVFGRASLLAARWKKCHRYSAFMQERRHRWGQADHRARLTAFKRALAAMGVQFSVWEGDDVPQSFKEAGGLGQLAGFIQSHKVSRELNRALNEIKPTDVGAREGSDNDSAASMQTREDLSPARADANAIEACRARRL